MIEEAAALVDRLPSQSARMLPMEARLAGVMTTSRRYAETDRASIMVLYAEWLILDPSPVVALGGCRAVVIRWVPQRVWTTWRRYGARSGRAR